MGDRKHNFDNEEDIRIVKLILGGDKEAFAQIVMKYKDIIFNLALRMLGNAADAEDATQEIFIKCYMRLNTFDTNHKFYSWLYTIAINLCKDKLKSRENMEKARTISLDSVATQTEAEMLKEIAKYESATDKEVLARIERQQIINKMLSLLPADYRTVFYLRYIDGYSLQEIAEMLQLPLGTVKTYLHRGRKILYEKREELGYKKE
jgi:RNA polymerase sigma-70 factor (ECF subfamily)